MKDFRYDAPQKEAEIEYILKTRKQKIARQQAVFMALFVMAVLSVIYYWGYRQVYTELDGYIYADVNNVRASDDILLLTIFPELGQEVHPGDTLYSYLFLSGFLEPENISREPEIVTLHRQSFQKLEEMAGEADVLRSRIAVLKKNIECQERDIKLGIGDNAYLRSLENEYHEANAELVAKEKSVVVLRASVEQLFRKKEMSEVENDSVQFQNLHVGIEERLKNKKYIRYALCNLSGFVTDINVANKTRIFKKDPIMSVQGKDVSESHVRIVAYVPFDKIQTVTRTTIATVIIGDKLKLRASVAVQGARTEELPLSLQSNFSRNNRVNISILTFLPGQNVPFWAISEGVPVKIRINNFNVELPDKSIDVEL